MYRALPLVLLACLAPTTALAEARFVNGTSRLEDDGFYVRLEANEALGQPEVRVSPGFVRAWFPGMRAARLDLSGDGTAVRQINVRPGVNDTAVTIIRIGDMRRLPEEAVTVEVEGSRATIRLARVALPRPTAPAPVAAPAPDELRDLTADLEPAAETAALANPEAEPEADTEADTAEGTPENASDETAAAGADADEDASDEAASPLALTRSAEALPLSAEDGPSTTIILVTLTFLLGLAYFGMRVAQKKRKSAGPHADIEIVATKRLGARHQLLVVRALGEDHLLAVQQGKTERLASMPAPARGSSDGDGLGDEEDRALPFLQLGAGDTAGNRTLHRKKIDERPRFGADLMRLVAERSRGDRVNMPAAAAAASPSDAVAGLLRLREKLGR